MFDEIKAIVAGVTPEDPASVNAAHERVNAMFAEADQTLADLQKAVGDAEAAFASDPTQKHFVAKAVAQQKLANEREAVMKARIMAEPLVWARRRVEYDEAAPRAAIDLRPLTETFRSRVTAAVAEIRTAWSDFERDANAMIDRARAAAGVANSWHDRLGKPTVKPPSRDLVEQAVNDVMGNAEVRLRK
ncbi:MAG TPA: hypothetical protein VHM25_28875 [Polyangiaceae bacterium]|jgi:hypothetical protein|nr:hypothetical protein [Polyangiaceae bacterium]